MLGLKVSGLRNVQVAGLDVVRRHCWGSIDHYGPEENRGQGDDTEGEHVVC